MGASLVFLGLTIDFLGVLRDLLLPEVYPLLLGIYLYSSMITNFPFGTIIGESSG